MKDNADRLLEAVEHPERYSDEELAMLFNDSEVRNLYDTMTKTSGLLTETPEPDIDMEWRRFAAANRKKKLLRLPFSRHAAAAVVAIVASLAMVAATIGIKYTIEHPAPQETDVRQPYEATEGTSGTDIAVQDSMTPESLPVPETRVFSDETLERIIVEICEYYGASAEFKSAAAKNLRLYFKWDQSQPLSDVVDQLNNFEQIDITLDKEVITVE